MTTQGYITRYDPLPEVIEDRDPLLGTVAARRRRPQWVSPRDYTFPTVLDARRNRIMKDAVARSSFTTGEARVLAAWKQLRVANPYQQPTTHELAQVLRISPSSAHETVLRLLDKGALTRLHSSRRVGRCFALTAEAAALPYLAEMLSIMTALVRLQPGALEAGDADAHEQYAVVWAKARALCSTVVMCCKAKHARHLKGDDCEAVRHRTGDEHRSGQTSRPRPHLADQRTVESD